jgi:coproporphyrinogen III oxidase-like Fe-S oxidoreductase
LALCIGEAARKIGFESVNVDFIYGLPLQTLESFARGQTCVQRPSLGCAEGRH